MIEIIFLLALALIWTIFAVIQDLKSREIANWLNFSLILFALSFRFFYSLFNDNFNFLYQGLIGLGIFFVLGNLFYYGKIFAGGDAKLMIALGSILFLYNDFFSNIRILFLFLFLFLFSGAFYGLFASFVITSKNIKKFKKEFLRIIKRKEIKIYFIILFTTFLVFLLIFQSRFIFVTWIFFILFLTLYLFIYAKAIDRSCMIKKIRTRELREGDWLYKDLKVGDKIIKANWNGLTKEEIGLLRKKRRYVVIKQGVAFSPAFLISIIFLSYIVLFNPNLINFYGILFGR